ncbi:MAG TPA: metal ABC transporter ATP-binding protein [bacterium]|nr:metal ABC transporter ATP-binding protein [bacterium]
MNELFLEFKGVAIGYGRKVVLSGINFSISKGDFLGIVGPNGTGKTTLLKNILGVLKPLEGEIVSYESFRIGYVPQVQSLDPIFPLTVSEIVRMTASVKINDEKFYAILKELSLFEFKDKLFRNLSGGFRQRVLIARALVAEPELLVLDEPTNDLDIPSETSIMELIQHLNREHRIAIVMVTHVLDLLINTAYEIGFLSAGKLFIDSRDEILKEDKLKEIYGTKVRIAEVDGKKMVVT